MTGECFGRSAALDHDSASRLGNLDGPMDERGDVRPQQEVDLALVDELLDERGGRVRVATVVAYLDAAVFVVDPVLLNAIALSGVLTFLGIPARYADSDPEGFPLSPRPQLRVCRASPSSSVSRDLLEIAEIDRHRKTT